MAGNWTWESLERVQFETVEGDRTAALYLKARWPSMGH